MKRKLAAFRASVSVSYSSPRLAVGIVDRVSLGRSASRFLFGADLIIRGEDIRDSRAGNATLVLRRRRSIPCECLGQKAVKVRGASTEYGLTSLHGNHHRGSVGQMPSVPSTPSRFFFVVHLELIVRLVLGLLSSPRNVGFEVFDGHIPGGLPTSSMESQRSMRATCGDNTTLVLFRETEYNLRRAEMAKIRGKTPDSTVRPPVPRKCTLSTTTPRSGTPSPYSSGPCIYRSSPFPPRTRSWAGPPRTSLPA